MSGKNIFKSSILKSGIVVGASMVALTLGACASSGSSSSRYGSVYDYESAGSCNSAPCAAAVTPPATTSYGTTTVIGGQPVVPGIVYTDCSQMAAVGCGAPYAPPVPVYTPPAPVGCPIDMIMTSDGSCVMQTTSSWSTNTVSCPSHTRQASDGTCMIIDDTPNVTIYPTTGYVPPVDYTAPVYQPIRK